MEIAVGGIVPSYSTVARVPSRALSPCASPAPITIAYAGSSTLAFGVFVREFPNVETTRISISPEGRGAWPAWSRYGTRLFYEDRGVIYAVPVDAASGLSHGEPEPVVGLEFRFPGPLRTWDVAPDGRFLLLKPVESMNEDAEPAATEPERIDVIVNSTRNQLMAGPARGFLQLWRRRTERAG